MVKSMVYYTKSLTILVDVVSLLLLLKCVDMALVIQSMNSTYA